MSAENHENQESMTDYRTPREVRRESRQKNPFRGLFWGLALILLGILFFAAQQDWVSDDFAGKLFLVGLGAIFLLDALVHYLNPPDRSGASGRFIAGVVVLFIGLATIFGLDRWWPLVLIAAGIALLSGVWLRNRKI
jgi:hypothetical protein